MIINSNDESIQVYTVLKSEAQTVENDYGFEKGTIYYKVKNGVYLYIYKASGVLIAQDLLENTVVNGTQLTDSNYLDILGDLFTEPGGSGGNTPTPKPGQLRVRWIDSLPNKNNKYLIKEVYVDRGTTVKAPAYPKHPDFPMCTPVGWTHDASYLENIQADLDIGILYNSDATYIDIELLPVNGLTHTFQFYRTSMATYILETGDGQSITIPSGTTITLPVTFSDYGKYRMKIVRISGTGQLLLGGNASAATSVFSTDNSIIKGVISIAEIPVGQYAFYQNLSLEYVVFDIRGAYDATSMVNAFTYCSKIKAIVDYRLNKSNIWVSSMNLDYYVISPVLGTNRQENSPAREDRSIRTIIYPSGYNNLTGSSWSNAYNLEEVVIYETVPPAIAASTYQGTNKQLKIYVPDSALNAYKTAANWVALASRIFPFSAIRRDVVNIAFTPVIGKYVSVSSPYTEAGNSGVSYAIVDVSRLYSIHYLAYGFSTTGYNFYDKDGTFISGRAGTINGVLVLQIPEGAKYVILNYQSGANEQIIGYLRDNTRSEEDLYAYGIEYSESNTASTLTRICNLSLHRSLPIQEGMKTCLLKDDGTVSYYLSDNDRTIKADGTPSVLDGTDGQVMVEIPPHYRRFDTIAIGSLPKFQQAKISNRPLEGYSFVPKTYRSAFEAVLDRTVPSAMKLSSVMNISTNYRGGNFNQSAWDGTYRSLLGLPSTQVALNAFRAAARRRGNAGLNGYGWNCEVYEIVKTCYWLYVIEYAERNIQLPYNPVKSADGYAQGGLGDGVVTLAASTWNTYNGSNPIIPCGYTNSLGNRSGIVQFTLPAEYGNLTVQVPSYRGLENIFGHTWDIMDGVALNASSASSGGNSDAYVCDDPALYSENVLSNWRKIGSVARISAFIQRILGEDIQAVLTGGNSVQCFTDKFDTNVPATGVDVLYKAMYGGNCSDSSNAGICRQTYVTTDNSNSSSYGTRLCFIPAPETENPVSGDFTDDIAGIQGYPDPPVTNAMTDGYQFEDVSDGTILTSTGAPTQVDGWSHSALSILPASFGGTKTLKRIQMYASASDSIPAVVMFSLSSGWSEVVGPVNESGVIVVDITGDPFGLYFNYKTSDKEKQKIIAEIV